MSNNKNKFKSKKLDKKLKNKLKKQIKRPKVYFAKCRKDGNYDEDVICTTTGLEPGEIAATNYIKAEDIIDLKAKAYKRGFRVLRSLTVAKYKSFNDYKEKLYATPVILASYLEDTNEDSSTYSSEYS